jgi:hypothetical protein
MALVDLLVHMIRRNRCRVLLLLPVLGLSTLHAQTVDDAIMIPGKTLFTGTLYTHDSWDHYWEGPLNRVNGNLGTVTTDTVTFSANYGIMDRLNLIGTVPLVWTDASQGVLSGMQGWQDISLAAKYRVLTTPIRDAASLSVFGVVFGSIPLTNYTPDFQPLSIGLGSTRVGGRITLNFQSNRGWFLNATSAYTWRGSVTLDRPYYFTEDQLSLTNDVKMPDVVDYSISPGYLRKGRMAQFTFSKQITQGGGDIRRQDMPFISNRIIFSKVGFLAMYPLPFLKSLTFRFEYSYVIDGRNVGQASTFTTGLLQTVSFKRRKSP